MENLEINVQSRTTKGNGPSRVLRRDRKVPAILYGPQTASQMLTIEGQQMETLEKKGSLGRSVFNLRIDGQPHARTVMIKELQTHPISGTVLHVDFYEVAMDRKIRVSVPVHTVGTPIGLDKGGMLQMVRRELEIHCLPDAIPDAITIDVSNLDIGESVHVEDVRIDGAMEIPHETNFTVLTVAATKKEEAALTEEEAPAEGEAGPETAAE